MEKNDKWAPATVQSLMEQYIGESNGKETWGRIKKHLNEHFGDASLSWTVEQGDRHLTFTSTVNGKEVSVTYRHNF